MKVVLFLLGVLAAGYEALAFKILWGWFVAPTFELPTLTYWIAFGIAVTLGVLTQRIPSFMQIHYQKQHHNEREASAYTLTQFTMYVLGTTYLLSLGFVIHLIA